MTRKVYFDLLALYKIITVASRNDYTYNNVHHILLILETSKLAAVTAYSYIIYNNEQTYTRVRLIKLK